MIDFLHYVEDSSSVEGKEESNEKLRRIHNRVRKVKENEEVGVKYMQKWEELAYAKEAGREKGKAEGKAEIVLEFLSEYGEIPLSLKKEILSQTDLDKLDGWSKLAARVGSVEAFIEQYSR